MRTILFLLLVVIVLALVGWISFSRDDGRSSINLETQEISDDTKKALNSGAALLEKAGDKIDQAKTTDADK